jgi:DNA-directed RNA polymerase
MIRPEEAAWTELLKRQKELEDVAHADGVARFRRRLDAAREKGAAASTGAEHALLRLAIKRECLEKAIDAMVAKPSGQGGGKRHTAAKWCKLVGAEVVTYLTLKVVLDQLGTERKLNDIARALSGMLLDELRYRRFKKDARHLFDYKVRSFHTNNYRHMSDSMDASMRYAGIDCSDLTMSDEHRLLVGIKLIDMLRETTGMVEVVETVKRSGRKLKRTMHLVATDDTEEWIEEANATLEGLHPVVLPMVAPPLRWEPANLGTDGAVVNPPVRGGFRFQQRDSFPMVRRDKQPQSAPRIAYDTVNKLQESSWKINRQVLDVVVELKARGGGMAGIPQLELKVYPARPDDIAVNEASRKQWRGLKHAVVVENLKRKQVRRAFFNTLGVAEKFQHETAFYFPHSFDFRGRVYPLSSYLTPQGDDLSRALLTFAVGKPVDEAGARYLAVHGANCLGETLDGKKISQMTLDERIACIHGASTAIIAVADDPFKHRWWMDADKPLMFLAFCFEWAGLIRANDQDKEYVGSLVVSQDGSCNGLQHFAALLRDEGIGRAVNVVPQDRPADIYRLVASTVLDRITLEADAGSKLAGLWLGLHAKTGIISRKLTKRPTMTFGYGSKQYGFTQQIREFLVGLDNYATIKEHFTGDPDNADLNDACAFMARIIRDSLEEHVKSAFACMDWLQAEVKALAEENKCASWTVPATGFRITQRAFALTSDQIRTMLAGKEYRPRAYKETDQVNVKKQIQSVAANVIHSLDAAALMLTVQIASSDGVECFAMVHDSYGTLAADCEVVAQAARRAFAKLYIQHDPLASLGANFETQGGAVDPSLVPPQPGTLDVSQVIGSTYFFS